MVLVLIVVVSYMLVRFIERAQVEVRGEGYYVQRADLRLQAWSMMEVAVAVLADVKAIENALYSPAQGWSDPIGYAEIAPPAGLEVRYEFIDESAKLNINAMDEDLLVLLFEELGFDLHDRQELASVLLDWIDEDDEPRLGGAEAREYSTADLAMHPVNGPLRTLEELKSLIGYREQFFDENGIPNARFRQLERVATVRQANRLNVNAADPIALRAFAGMSDLQIQALNEFIAGLDGQRGTEDDQYFASSEELSVVVGDLLEGAILDNQITVLTIKVTVADGQSAFTLSGTIDTQSQASGGGGENAANLQYPFLFLEIKEEPSMNNNRLS